MTDDFPLVLTPEDLEDDPSAVGGDTLPHEGVIHDNLPYPVLPDDLDENSEESDIAKDDIARVNFVIQKLGNAWKVARDVDDYVKMTLATLKALETRRKVLGLKWGKDPKDPGSGGAGTGGDGDLLQD